MLALSKLLAACPSKAIRLATAEGCTCGLIAAALTSVAGASDVLGRGFVACSNEAKNRILGMPDALIECCGAQVAAAMAVGTMVRSLAAIAVTGVAGPGGGSAERPVGLV